MKNLNQVLSKVEIVDGIIANLGEICRVDVEDIIRKALSSNVNYFSKIRSGDHTLECTLHYDKDKKRYLLEARLFDENDMMVNAYLEVMDSELNIDPNFYDDVWSIADWKQICICDETNCILSDSSKLSTGETVFSDLRLDLDNNELDIEHGLIGDNGYAKESSWTHSLKINYCPVCGKKLEEVE